MMSSRLFRSERPARTYKITASRFPSEVVQACMLAYLSIHGPSHLQDFARCDGLAHVPVRELSEAISVQVVLGHVRMWRERVLIRNDEGHPSIGHIERFALAASDEGGDL